MKKEMEKKMAEEKAPTLRENCGGKGRDLT